MLSHHIIEDLCVLAVASQGWDPKYRTICLKWPPTPGSGGPPLGPGSSASAFNTGDRCQG
jgi:hypothetical protein